MPNQYWGQVGTPSGASLIAKAISDSLEKQKAQKLALAQSLIQSGTYQPTAPGTTPPPNMIQNAMQGLMGPQPGGQNMNVGGQNYQYSSQPMAGSTMGGLPLGEITRDLPGGAKATYKNPTSQYLSPEDAIAKYKQAQDAAKNAGLTGVNVGQSATGRTTITPESGFQQRTDVAKQMAPKIFDSLKKGNFTAYDKADPMVKDLVGGMASDAGVDLDSVRNNMITSMSKARTAGSPQITRFTSAENSLGQSLNVLDDLSDKYQRSNFMPTIANKIKIVYDKEVGDNGAQFQKPRFTLGDTKDLSSTQQQMAIRYISQLNFAKDQLAVVYSGGYAAQQWAYDMATQSINPLYGPKGQAAATNQIRVEMSIRKQGLRDALATGKNNMDIQPSEQVTDTDAQPSADTYEEGQTATNPTTNEKMIFKGGQWQPIK